jgi:hypothetical protein
LKVRVMSKYRLDVDPMVYPNIPSSCRNSRSTKTPI